MKKQILYTLIFLLISGILTAEWSDDPAMNNAICDLTGEQAIPKAVIGPTGDTYIGYFSNDSGNYDVRMQRFDPLGNELWANDGIVISDNPAMTWLTDWDMIVDQDNHAILTFQDIRNVGNNNAYAYRIAPDGTFVWGEDGLELSNSAAFDASPKVCVTSVGNTVITWQADVVIIMQKISPDGTLLWGDNGITMSCADTYSWPQPFAVENDNILLKFYHDSGPIWAPTRHLYVQKFDADGNAVWAEDTVVSNVTGITAWTQVLNIISDGNNGCFISWHDSRGGGTISFPFVQHVLSDGSVGFIANGVQLSTETNRQNFYPESVYDANSGDLVTYWSQTDGNQNDHGITGQKLDSDGNLLWGANGNNLIPISTLYIQLIAVRAIENDLMILIEEYTDAVNAYVKAMKIDPEGNYIWLEEQVTMCSVASEKIHSVASQAYSGQLVSAWEDDRNGTKDIFAQNINEDGTIGVIPIGPNPPQNLAVDPATGLATWDAPESDPDLMFMNYNLYLNGTYFNFQEETEWQLTDLINGATYEVGVSALYIIQGESEIITTEFTYSGTDADDYLILRTSLLGNHPNPFNPNTTISFSLALDDAENAMIEIFNIKGQKIRQYPILNDQTSITWDGTDKSGKTVSSGIYYYKMVAGKYNSIEKMLLMK